MKLQQFLQEDNGRFSATRLAFLFWSIGVLVVWITISLYQHTLSDLPQSIYLIIGMLMSGKVIQKFGESKNDNANATPANGGGTKSATGGSTTP